MLLGEGCTCHEGYGMTETTGATCVTSSDDLSLGHVGGPFPCCEVRDVLYVCVCAYGSVCVCVCARSRAVKA